MRKAEGAMTREGEPISGEVAPEIIEHYQHLRDEQQRLMAGRGLLEYLRTQELIRRYLADDLQRILDVGGGAGIHAAWLAGDGHQVHLIDPVPRHVEQAGEVAAGLDQPFTAGLGDARQLDQPDESVDVVLLLGPLYHLTEESDRVQALSEARRVLAPGGLVFAAGITRFGSLFDGLARGYIFDPEFRAIVERDLEDGQHRNPSDNPGWFTTAFFHHPDQLEDEARRAGLKVRELFGIEGLAGLLPSLDERFEDPEDIEVILASARATESEPSLRGLGNHLLLVAERQA